MIRDKSESIASRFLQAWSVGGEGIIDELAAPDLLVQYSHFPAPIQGAQQFKEILHQTHHSFPDLHLTVEEVICEGEQAVVRWNYRGTHQQDEVFGIAPTGKAVDVSGITILQIRDGKVIKESGIVDNFSLLQQLQ